MTEGFFARVAKEFLNRNSNRRTINRKGETIMTIITLNGKQMTVDARELSFEEICDLANMPVSSSVTITGLPIRGRTMLKGQSIETTDNMVIDCVPTGHA